MKLTRPEFSLLAGLSLIFGSVLFGAGFAGRAWQLRRMVNRDFRSIELALYDYAQKTKGLPVTASPLRDVRFGTSSAPNRNLCQVLLGTSTLYPDLNKESLRYLRAGEANYRKSGINNLGDFVDPWGQPYQLVLDATNDFVCDLPGTRYTQAIGVSVAIWSYGPDQKPDTEDDLLSWN